VVPTIWGAWPNWPEHNPNAGNIPDFQEEVWSLGKLLIVEDKAEVRGRVERVDGNLTTVRFSNVTDALAKLITPPVPN
jgi:hypothetical protein